MVIRREWVTPITTGAFLLMTVTGVLIFFHVDSGANKFVHEWLGWVLLGGAALHAAANFAALKRHLASRRGQVLIGVFVVALAASFIPASGKSEPPFAAPIRALSQARLTTVAEVARVSPAQVREQLSKAGYHVMTDQQSVSDLVGPDMGKQMRVLSTLFSTGG